MDQTSLVTFYFLLNKWGEVVQKQSEHVGQAPHAAGMDGEKRRESEGGAAEEQEKTENCEVVDVKHNTDSVLMLRLNVLKSIWLTETSWCVSRAAFYLMNEKELVEAAVSILTDASCDDVTEQKVGLFLSF